MFSAAKLAFAYGLGNSMNFPLNYGACTILSDERPSPEMTFRLIEKYSRRSITAYPRSTPRSAGRWKRKARTYRASVSVSAESLPAPIFYRWEENSIRRSTD